MGLVAYCAGGDVTVTIIDNAPHNLSFPAKSISIIEESVIFCSVIYFVDFRGESCNVYRCME